MLRKHCRLSILACLVFLLPLASAQQPRNKALGEVDLQGASKVEKDSGVWVDGQYVGYLKELHGDKTLLLIPGEHEIVVKQDGYTDFSQKVTVQPGEKLAVPVKMEKDPRFEMPKVFAEIKLAVNPNRAAVFVDGLLVGHVGDFDGVAKSLLVAPGHHKISISLPGYQTFETEVDLEANQKFQIKTDLQKAPVPTNPAPQP
jgi:PEGA domain